MAGAWVGAAELVEAAGTKAEQTCENTKTIRFVNQIQPAGAYKDCSGSRGWTWGRDGGGRGALIGGNAEGWSAGLPSDALLQLSETRV